MMLPLTGFQNDPKTWTVQTLSELNRGLYEREDTIALTLLTVLSGQSVFLYGPPGTAKSLIARRMSDVFSDSKYFEYLMQRFSTPEEVFGPVSIAELKNDNYQRKTENYLPTADIAFLDEIWKSSPAILNTLLTIINERKFKNGSKVDDVPLKAVIAASNEVPSPNSGLDALYDRFIVRLSVTPITEDEDFHRMLAGGSEDYSGISAPLTTEDLGRIIRSSDAVTLGPDALEIIDSIRRAVSEYNGTENAKQIYVSDRRWLKAAKVLKTAAYLSGRDEVSPADLLILRSCLWSDSDDKKILDDIVDSCVSSLAHSITERFDLWKENLDKLQKEIGEKFKPRVKAYKDPVVINDMGCYPLDADLGPNSMSITVYVPFGPKKVDGIYTAYGSSSSTYQFQVVGIDGREALIKFLHGSPNTFRVPLEIGSGDSASDQTLTVYRRSVDNSMKELSDIISCMNAEIKQRSTEFDSPFVPEKDLLRIFTALNDKLGEMEGRMPDIQSLEDRLNRYARR